MLGLQQKHGPRDTRHPSSQQQPSDTPAAPDGVDPEIHSALQNPKVRAFVEAEVSQAYQARAAYARRSLMRRRRCRRSWRLYLKDPIFRENTSDMSQVIAHAEPTAPRTDPTTDRGSIRNHESDPAARRSHPTGKPKTGPTALRDMGHTGSRFPIEKMYPEFADKEKAPALRASVAQYLTETVGIPRRILRQLWNSDLVRDAMSQKIIWDAGTVERCERKARTAVPVDLPLVQRPGVSQGHRHDAYEHVEDLRGQLRNTSGEAQMRLATKMIQAKREARR